MDTLAILVAAGRGERMGLGRPKAFLALHGQTLLLRAARALAGAPSVDAVVAVVPADRIDEARGELAGIAKLSATVAGGARRQDSVQAGLDQAPDGFDGVVLVHDAARALAPSGLVEQVCQAARRHGAALPVLPIPDTVKRVRAGRVVATLDRAELAGAQTPQAARFQALRSAYQAAAARGVEVTDESAALEQAGVEVVAIPGSALARKLTTPDDLAWAEALLASAVGTA